VLLQKVPAAVGCNKAPLHALFHCSCKGFNLAAKPVLPACALLSYVQMLDLMASTGSQDVLLGYYRASIGLPPKASSTGSGGSGTGKLSTSGLVAAIVVSVCVGGGGLVLVGALLVQLQRARTRSLTGKVRE
jgi:hypothetical protein